MPAVRTIRKTILVQMNKIKTFMTRCPKSSPSEHRDCRELKLPREYRIPGEIFRMASGSIFNLMLLLSAGIYLTGCERDDGKRAQRNGAASEVDTTSRSKTRVSDRRTDRDRNVSGSSRHSKAEMLRAISEINLNDGVSEEQLKIVRELIHTDPEGALDALYTKDNVCFRLEFTKICEEMSNSGEDLLIRWLNEKLPKLTDDKRIQSHYWADLMGVIAKADPEHAVTVMTRSELSGKDIKSSIIRLFLTTSNLNPDRALKLLDSLPASYKEAAYSGLSYSLANSDPSKALEFVALIQDSKERALVSSFVFDQWLKASPDTACERLSLLKDQFEEIGITDIARGGDIIKTLCEKNPNVLRDLLYQVVPASKNQALFEKAIGEMARNNIDSAFAVVNDLPQSALKDKLMMEAFSIGEPPKDLSGINRMISTLEGKAKEAAIMGLARMARD
jgi:hypothetical protein